ISQPAKCGPSNFQFLRFPSDVRIKAPFRVPANTRIPLIVYISNCGLRESSPKSNINSQTSNFARIGGHRPPLQRNSVPECRRCEGALTPLWFCHEEFKLSYYSSCERGCSDGTACGCEWRIGPCHRCRGLTGWFSVSPLSALRPGRRAYDSFSLRGNSGRSPVFRKRANLRACRTMRALPWHG